MFRSQFVRRRLLALAHPATSSDRSQKLNSTPAVTASTSVAPVERALGRNNHDGYMAIGCNIRFLDSHLQELGMSCILFQTALTYRVYTFRAACPRNRHISNIVNFNADFYCIAAQLRLHRTSPATFYRPETSTLTFPQYPISSASGKEEGAPQVDQVS